jgi:hypothetical protein
MPLARFATKSTTDRGANGERCLNYYVEATGGLSEATLYGRYGTAAQVDLGGPVRAEISFNGFLYAVAGGKLWKISGATKTEVGAVGASEHVCIGKNASQIALIVGSTYYASDGTTVSSYATGAVETPVWLTYQDGYIIVVGEGQGRDDILTVSSLDDATTFAGLDFAAAESGSDALLAAISDHGELWLFGTSTIEMWYNSGDADFPFARNNGAKIERGLHKASTVAKEDNAVFFVGDDLIVYRATGVAPQVISTRDVEKAIRAGEIHSAYTFEERGHKFYAIRLTSATTWVYDMTTQLWHERSTGTEEQPWFISCAVRLSGQQYFGTDTGKIVTLSDSAYTDDGATVVAEAVSVPEYRANELSVSRVHLQIAGGVGGIGRTPRVMLQATKNGHTWSQERWRNLGGLGEYGRSAEWFGLGAFNRFQLRLRITDAVPRDIYGVHYDAS